MIREEIELKKKLQRINNVFNVYKILSLTSTPAYIQKYYKINRLGYSLFHTSTDLIYMGVSRDGIYKEKDLLEAARTVEKYITLLRATHVLELATGRGANSAYLAKRNQEIKFDGIDLSEGQLQFARKKADTIKNYYPTRGDYHNLPQFKDSTFDIVFIVEALCYSERKEIVLAEVHRILKPNGVFIIFDGYREREYKKLSQDEKTAMQLTEKTMALNAFEPYREFRENALKNFIIEKEEDVSEFVLPTMHRFERLAKKFFQFPFLAKLFIFILPKEFTYNAVAGYLMPILVKTKAFSYKIVILKKTEGEYSLV